MNKIWLIEGKVTKTPYMIYSTQFIDRRIVFAQTENEAYVKSLKNFGQTKAKIMAHLTMHRLHLQMKQFIRKLQWID